MQHMQSALQMKVSQSSPNSSPTNKVRKPKNYETLTSSAKSRVVAHLGPNHQKSIEILLKQSLQKELAGEVYAKEEE